MLYINDFCAISPMGIFRPDTDISTWEIPLSHDADSVLYACEPDYGEWISPLKQRRMSKPVRMAVAAMKMCFGTKIPDSIHIGSAFGQLSDSQRFLETMINQDEVALPPTAFIQSTHNTVSGALALEVGAHGHNFTFVNTGHSFEDAFYDAVLTSMDSNSGGHQLLGAVDEMIPMAARAIRAENCADGGILGEGGVLFKTSARRETDSLTQVLAFEKVVTPVGGQNIHQYFEAFLKIRHIEVQHTDLWLCSDKAIATDKGWQGHFFTNFPLSFKAFCGGYPTHSAFGLAYALSLLNRHPTAKRVWLITHFGAYWSFWLLAK